MTQNDSFSSELNKLFTNMKKINEEYKDTLKQVQQSNQSQYTQETNGLFNKQSTSVSFLCSMYLSLYLKYNWVPKIFESNQLSNIGDCRLCEKQYPLTFLMKCQTCLENMHSKNFLICLNCLTDPNCGHIHKFQKIKEIHTTPLSNSLLITGDKFNSSIQKNSIIKCDMKQSEKFIEQEITFKNTGQEEWKSNIICIDTPKNSELLGFQAFLKNNISPGETITIKVKINSEGRSCGLYYSIWQLYNTKLKKFFGEAATFNIKIGQKQEEEEKKEKEENEDEYDL